MSQQCPECKAMFNGGTCDCGFQVASKGNKSRDPVKCAHISSLGKSCLLSPSVSHHVPSEKGYPPTYCSFHFRNLNSLENAESKDKFAAFIIPYLSLVLESKFDWVDYLWNLSCGERPATKPPFHEFTDPPTEIDLRGVAMLKEFAPKLYAKFLLSHPEFEKTKPVENLDMPDFIDWNNI